MCIKLECIEDLKETRRFNTAMRKAKKELPDSFNPDHLERLRENLVRSHTRTMRTVDEIAAVEGRPFKISDYMVEVPIPDHLKTRELQWQHLLRKYQKMLQRADSLVTYRERRDGSVMEEPWPPEKIRDRRAKCLVMIAALTKKIDDESTPPSQSNA